MDRQVKATMAYYICEILATVYGDAHPRFEADARGRGTTIDELAAGAISEMLAQRFPAITSRHQESGHRRQMD